MEPMSEQELAELERLHKAAMPGPWRTDDEPGNEDSECIYAGSDWSTRRLVAQMMRVADRDYAIAACNAAPRLVAELRAAREEVAALRARMEALVASAEWAHKTMTSSRLTNYVEYRDMGVDVLGAAIAAARQEPARGAEGTDG